MKDLYIWWVFAGDKYYPNGGMCDFQKAFLDKESAELFVKSSSYDWSEIKNISDIIKGVEEEDDK